ncbi:MAG: hypothetical protein VW380_01655 [Candidatus Woesearchaeota archaeon]
MKSFEKFIHDDKTSIIINENTNPLELGRIINIYNEDEHLDIDVLVVRSETPEGAILLVLTKTHPDVGSLINSKSLPDNSEFNIINNNRIPISNYFFQNSNPAPIKKIEYHDKNKLKENIDEDINRNTLLFFQSKYRTLKNKSAIDAKLNLLIELILSEMDDTKIRFIP